jgi:hypothetical protein
MRRLALTLGLATAGAVLALPTAGTVTAQDCFSANGSQVLGTRLPATTVCTPTGNTVGDSPQICKSTYGLGRETARVCVRSSSR